MTGGTMPLAVASAAADAYAAVARLTGVGPGTAAPASAGPEFAGLVRAGLTGTVASLRAGEAASVAGIGGTLGTQAVVETVAQAELALQKVTAVRDRVIAAYQEIIRMPM
jgi:flagellar hook-basal body complex protein FliE